MYNLYWANANTPHAKYLCLYNTYIDNAILVAKSIHYITPKEFQDMYPEYFI